MSAKEIVRLITKLAESHLCEPTCNAEKCKEYCMTGAGKFLGLHLLPAILRTEAYNVFINTHCRSCFQPLTARHFSGCAYAGGSNQDVNTLQCGR